MQFVAIPQEGEQRSHFEIFPCGLQPLSLTGPLLLVSKTVREAPWQQHFQTSSFITIYLVIQSYLTSVIATSLNTGQVLFQTYVCSPHMWTQSVSNTWRQLNIENSSLTNINNEEKHSPCRCLLHVTRSLLVEDSILNKQRNLEADLRTKASILPTNLLSNYFIICTSQKLFLPLEAICFITIAPVNSAVGHSY